MQVTVDWLRVIQSGKHLGRPRAKGANVGPAEGKKTKSHMHTKYAVLYSTCTRISTLFPVMYTHMHACLKKYTQ